MTVDMFKIKQQKEILKKFFGVNIWDINYYSIDYINEEFRIFSYSYLGLNPYDYDNEKISISQNTIIDILHDVIDKFVRFVKADSKKLYEPEWVYWQKSSGSFSIYLYMYSVRQLIESIIRMMDSMIKTNYPYLSDVLRWLEMASDSVEHRNSSLNFQNFTKSKLKEVYGEEVSH